MRKLLFLLLLSVMIAGLTGCGGVGATLTIITRETGETTLLANRPIDRPFEVETAESFHLQMSVLSWGRPISYEFGEVKAEYKFGEEVIGILEVSKGELITGAELEFANQLRTEKVGKNGLMALIPFPETADRVLVTMRVRCLGKWIEKRVIATKPDYGRLKAQIVADGLTSSGLLRLPSGIPLTLRCRVSGGVKPYTFKWLNHSEEVIGEEMNLTLPTIDCSMNGILSVTVTDANGKSAVI